MTLWLSAHFLVAGLILCSSAPMPTPEECEPLLTPSSLDKMFGRWNVLVGFTGGELFSNILKITESSYVTFSNGSTGLVMSEENRMGGKCFSSVTNVTIDNNMATVSVVNVTSVFHVLPSSDDCLVLSINSTLGNLENLLKFLNVSGGPAAEGSTMRSLYLMGRESTVKDSDLQMFKNQASCLGIPVEPGFYYDPKTDFCTQGESIKLTN